MAMGNGDVSQNQKTVRPVAGELLRCNPVVAVLRAGHASEYAPVIAALAAGGVTTIELTLSTAGVVAELPALLEEFGTGVDIGVGTITSLEEAVEVMDAGAKFLVTPITDLAVVEAAVQRNIPVFPGGSTPTELFAGWNAGATAVKVFPASTMGPGASAAEAVSYAVQQARAAGTLVSFDLNYRQALWPKEDAAVVFKALIEQADVVFAGDDEAAIVVGEASDPHQLAARIAALGPAQVVIKLGAEGAVALVDGETFTQPAIPIRPVDTVGAGDAFVAGYLAELLLGEPVGTRLLTAAQAGAFACLVPGDWEGMPRRSELGLLTAPEPVSR